MKLKFSISFISLVMVIAPSLLLAGEFLMQENKGQFHPNVLYKAPLNNGAVFIEKNKITFSLHDAKKLNAIKDEIHHHEEHNHKRSGGPAPTEPNHLIKSHAFSVEFLGANTNSYTEVFHPANNYYNYFIGANSSKWASKVKAFKELYIRNLYPNIDFKLFSKGDNIKYEFILKPGADPQLIQMHYEGVEKLLLGNNKVIIKTSAGDLIDQFPVSFYHRRKHDKVATQYQLSNNTVSFQLSEYNHSDTLILDPVLNFASFTGSSSDNWGYTATYDKAGNAYAGGISFGTGYPTTLGAFQLSFGGGTHGIYTEPYPTDISISKFSSDGRSLIYSTYLGGNKQECPHSLVVTDNDQLIVFGTTSSPNFPTSAGAFDISFNGGDDVLANNVLLYEGTDIVVTKFSGDGGSLVGSTYFGGSNNDGLNDAEVENTLHHNYSDAFRGEVITDSEGTVYIATSTNSRDIPVINGFQNTFGGGDQDGCIIHFNSNLSEVLWSSYLGGSLSDAVYGLQSSSTGELFVTGGTTSSNFPTVNGAQNTFAGAVDGFLARINNSGSTLLSSTFIGSTEYDQGYFVQLDTDDKVYVYGQTTGNLPISDNTYNNPNSGQFIQKYNTNLDQLEIGTLVGSSSDSTDIVPSAFLVNNCGQIYIAGWGGEVNEPYGGGTTRGLPVTGDAQQTLTDGSDFYMMVLSKDMESLNYATYFGSSEAEEHVDGGTSRFDKNGIVYQAVCSACGRATTFPTTPGAYAETMSSPNCNLAVFKFDASTLTAIIDPTTNTSVCKSDTIPFVNRSNGGEEFEWIFPDGSTSTDEHTYKVFDTAGTYEVLLVVKDPSVCPGTDTTKMDFIVSEYKKPNFTFNDTTICLGNSLTFEIDDEEDIRYTYSTLFGKPIPFSEQFEVSPTSNTSYIIYSSGALCPDSVMIPVKVLDQPKHKSFSVDLCENSDTALTFPFREDFKYRWIPEISTSTSNDTAFFSPTDSAVYQLEIESACGNAVIAFNINVTNIRPQLTESTSICEGDSLPISITGGDSYQWFPPISNYGSDASEAIFSSNTSNKHLVKITKNNCSKMDSIEITVLPPRPERAVHNEGLCNGEKATLPLQTQDDFTYRWIPEEDITVIDDSVVFSPKDSTNYVLTITGECGSAEVRYNIGITNINDSILPNFTTCSGDSTELFASGGDMYNWIPNMNMEDSQNNSPKVLIEGPESFDVEITKGSCTKTRSVDVNTYGSKNQKVPKDHLIHFGETQEINLSNEYTYSWTPNTYLNCSRCSSVLSEPEEDILYYVTYTDENGCNYTDSIQINVIFDLYVPNAFTPSTGGLNDVFYAYSHLIKDFHMDIFNRWGEKLFTSNDIHTGWDGTYQDQLVQSDVYIYKIKYVKVHTNKVIEKIGTVTLVR